MPELEVGKDPLGANRGKSYWEQAVECSSRAGENIRSRYYTPPYQSTNKHWEITFSALGWDRQTIERFWVVFCRINRSLSGQISLMEFLEYFDMDRTPYAERTFSYFDTTGGEDIDFLEFMVSVWNMCTLKVDTLTNFTLDLYDADSDGELSIPEIEGMVEELFGKNGKCSSQGRECIKDATKFAEDRGGTLNLNAFTIFTMNHSLLLFPMFQIQRQIQKKIMGERYWKNVERRRKGYTGGGGKQNVFDPRHVQILLRTYQTGGAAAVLAHTGDPNQGLREWFEKQNDGPADDQESKVSLKAEARSRWRSIRKAFRDAKKMTLALDQIKLMKRSSTPNGENLQEKEKTMSNVVGAFVGARKRRGNGGKSNNWDDEDSLAEEEDDGKELHSTVVTPDAPVTTSTAHITRKQKHRHADNPPVDQVESSTDFLHQKDDIQKDTNLEISGACPQRNVKTEAEQEPKVVTRIARKQKSRQRKQLPSRNRSDSRNKQLVRPRTPGSIVYPSDALNKSTSEWLASE